MDAPGMTNRAWLRLTLKALHDLAAIGVGGGFLAARETIAAIARYILLPSLAFVVVSGLFAIAATRGYHDAGWAWVKALLGLSLFEATLVTVGASREQAELAAAAADPALLASLLHSERNTLWLLIALCVANVVLAVWRPKLTVRIR